MDRSGPSTNDNRKHRVERTHSDMVLALEWTVFDRFNVSVIETMKGLNILGRSCTCVNPFRLLLDFGDIKAYEDSVCSLNKRYK